MFSIVLCAREGSCCRHIESLVWKQLIGVFAFNVEWKHCNREKRYKNDLFNGFDDWNLTYLYKWYTMLLVLCVKYYQSQHILLDFSTSQDCSMFQKSIISNRSGQSIVFYLSSQT